MSKIQFTHKYEDIISVDNLLEAWKEFLNGKKSKEDVQGFQRHLMSNILSLQRELKNRTYKHSAYEEFSISDPKTRSIHKAKVRDRLLHHAIYRILYPSFDKTFIADSYSCRLGKGTHKALERFEYFTKKLSRNNSKRVWILKCDIKKFFASVDQKILKDILTKYLLDKDIINLLSEIITSFHSTRVGTGLPLGNLTSQLLVNIYMNKFDQFVKHRLKARYYIRYADDFVFISQDRKWLENILSEIDGFLQEKLSLKLHLSKVFIKPLNTGVDFLGWVHFLDHRVLRTATKRKMFRRLKDNPKEESVASYLGLLKHGDAKRLSGEVKNFLS